MAQLKSFCKKIVLLVIMISIIIGSCAVPNSYAKLTIQDGEFYYAGTTKGSYVPSEGIFSWLFDILAKIAEFLLTLIPNVLRMAFVGYAAGAEKLLTWAVESTAGVNLQGEDMSSTDLTALSNSTNNVTVQAIVYNMVPAFNIDFFGDGLEKKDLYIKEIKEKDAEGNTQTKTVVISPTGQQLNCKKCGKSVYECCGDLSELADASEIKCYGSGGTNEDCGCNGCEACKKYAQLMLATDPIIVQLKTLVAVWYYLIRLLAVAAMAVVLVGIGIKMAVSTIASDKAVYKRMLVDWIVGIILIFTMHYIMILAITVNDILVNTIRESANSVNKVQLAQLAETSSDNKEVEKTNQDVEIDVYEEIRTRAYDMKMTVGLMGMIMYFALVFMAFKYTIIYVKRFLTLAVLTLMAPGLGVSYALQKALSGKSSSLKTWLTEYILNLFIQVVHALMYAIFISAALVYSLENVSGVILALILMNFSLKGEAIFRKIFNLDPKGGGLLGSTTNAAENLKKNVNTLKGLAMGAKPVAKAFAKPGAVVAGTVGKAGAAAGLMGGSLIAKGGSIVGGKIAEKAAPVIEKGKKAASNKVDSIKKGQGVSGKVYSAGRKIATPVTAAGRFFRKKKGGKSARQEEKELLNSNRADLEKNLAEAQNEYIKNPSKENIINALEANRKLERYRQLTARDAGDLTVGGVVAGHVKGLFDINNYFDVKYSKNGKKYYSMKAGVVFGKRKYNATTGKFEKDNSNAAYTQLGASKLLGFSDKDKKIFKEQIINPARNGVAGMVAMFAGMGTLVSHPLVGMGMLAGGAASTTSMVKKFSRPKNGQGRLKLIHRTKRSNILRKFKFGSFTAPAMANIRSNVIQQANRDLARILATEVGSRHPTFKEKLKDDLITPKTIIPVVGGIAIGTISLPAGILAAGVLRKTVQPSKNPKKAIQDPANGKYSNIYDPYGYEADRQKVYLHPVGNSALDIVDSHHFTQINAQMVEFDDEAGGLMNEQIKNNGRAKLSINIKNLDEKLDKLSDDDMVNLHAALQEAFADKSGHEYDSKTGAMQSTTTDLNVDKKDLVDEVEIKDKSGTIKKQQITDQDIKNVNEALNNAILARVTKKVEKSEKFDANDERILFDIINEVSSKPEVKQLLSNNAGVETLFKGGMSALKATIKEKAESSNNFVKSEMAKTLDLSGQEFDVVKESIMEVAEESANKSGQVDMSTLDQEKILEKIQSKINPESTTKDDKQKSNKNGKVNKNVDNILVKSKEATYKKAIDTLLTPNTSNKNNLKVNLKSADAKNKIDTILNSQTGSDSIQIRDRVKDKDVVSKSVKFEKNVTREDVKKSVKKQMLDLLEQYSDTSKASGKSGTQMTSKEKLAQAQAATESLLAFTSGSKEVESVRDTMLQSLFDMSESQRELRELNEYATDNFSQKSKFKKKKNKSYLQAQIEASEARADKSRFELLEKQTGKSDPAEKEKKERKVLLAEEALNSVGPVQDVNKATKSIIDEMRKNI